MAELAEIVVTDATALESCRAHLARCAEVGLDTEFVGEDTYHPKLCLIQLATAEALYLIDPFAFTDDELQPVWTLLADPARTLVVHAGREEIRLCHRAIGRAPANLFDLQIVAGMVGLAYPIGHSNLVGEVLGQSFSKRETLTEWRTRPLTYAQLRYAFNDVRYLLPLWVKLRGQLEQLGRIEWTQEDCARLAAAVTPGEPGEPVATDKWRKLRGSGSLDRRRLALLREMFQWREEEAARANRPARTVVRDDLLVEIARHPLKGEQDLHVVRGLAKRYAAPLWKAIERARAMPADQLPLPAERDLDPPQAGLIANVIAAVLADFCTKQRLAPSLVATSADVKMLVRSRMSGQALPTDSLLTVGWRAKHVLPELLAMLDGRRRLRIADIQADAPFAFDEMGEL